MSDTPRTDAKIATGLMTYMTWPDFARELERDLATTRLAVLHEVREIVFAAPVVKARITKSGEARPRILTPTEIKEAVCIAIDALIAKEAKK